MSGKERDGGAVDELIGLHPDEAAILALPQGPGHHVMARRDIEAAVGHGTSDVGDPDGGDAPSREDAARRREFARYRDDPDAMWRRHLVADAATLARVSRFGRDAPNMAAAVELARRSVILSKNIGLPLRLPPLLLVGPPGTGKSRFAGRLAEALGTGATTLVGEAPGQRQVRRPAGFIHFPP